MCITATTPLGVFCGCHPSLLRPLLSLPSPSSSVVTWLANGSTITPHGPFLPASRSCQSIVRHGVPMDAVNVSRKHTYVCWGCVSFFFLILSDLSGTWSPRLCTKESSCDEPELEHQGASGRLTVQSFYVEHQMFSVRPLTEETCFDES